MLKNQQRSLCHTAKNTLNDVIFILLFELNASNNTRYILKNPRLSLSNLLSDLYTLAMAWL